ncbi:GNAT family N-acetyltransferase [Kribbella solani]|uniref:GNAT family N-acetyltransferase n=1 Tax=Kribbella solani TaxID=236067 RepID=UPI0029A4D7A1|nr:GNAT family N-acetyltransferase [Kribbella solani]MDX2970007.1 GNAT family N-acetyltransferase [Kribbella solani]
MTGLRVVDVVAEQLDAVWEVRIRSFGPGGDREEWQKNARPFLDDGRLLGVVDGDRLVAAARIWPFEQWWHGRRVPMGGVAGVVVAPEYRGRGVGSLLMRGVLDRCADKGYPLTALYPATTVLYRQLGYEFAGNRYKFSFEAADLRTLGGKNVPVRKATKADAQLLMDLAGQAHAARRSSGPLIWPLSEIESWLDDEDNFAYLADDGFVVYNWSDGNLAVDELIAGSEETARALWATVGSGASIAKSVQAFCAPFDPIHLMAEHEAEADTRINRWMLRLVDAPAAIAGRGFPAGVTAELSLRIDDPELPKNTGDWQLSVTNGTGRLAPAESTSSTATTESTPTSAGAEGAGGAGGAGGAVGAVGAAARAPGDAVRLGPRGLAALYAGTPMATLRAAGLAAGGVPGAEGADSGAVDAVLDAVFGGSEPYVLDYF